ncbi:hypothetical protein JNUCC0626_50355 (plasmid) [Lentzea sp. JNUCC 0626]|uniref:hypothetical protein n=1 Tax=Lentzea sp. JNUCC 0626 TaxID=3367513 RepID=UPI00374A61A1
MTSPHSSASTGPDVTHANTVFGHLNRPADGTSAADRYDRWSAQARYDGTVTFAVIGRALAGLDETTGWYLYEPAKLYAPTANLDPGHCGVKYAYARVNPDGSADYLAVAGLDEQAAEIHLNGRPLTWIELCALMARDHRPLHHEPLVNPPRPAMPGDRDQELTEQAALETE